MPLQSQTRWAECIWAWVYSAIRKEFPETMLTNRTFYFVSFIKYSEYPKEKMTEELEIFPGDFSDNKADNVFHMIG